MKRYTEEPFAAFVENERGDFVKYSDHAARLHLLLSTLADIRAALGVGEKPMLGELAGMVKSLVEFVEAVRDDEWSSDDDREAAQSVLDKINGGQG